MIVRSMKGLRRYTCPFCGLRVLGDDAARTLHHEAPVCDRFSAEVSKKGLSPVRVTPAVFVDEDAFAASPSKKGNPAS